MSNSVVSLLDQIDGLASGASEGERSRVVRQLADLFVTPDTKYSDSQIELFDRVMIKLVDHVERATLQELSKTLSTLSVAPMDTLHRLATDDSVEVAGPLLTNSTLLDDSVLIRAAQSKSQEHLLAISVRDVIGPDVSKALIEFGDDRVVMSVAQNDGAEICSDGYSKAIDRAKNNVDLAGALGRRRNFPRQQLLLLIETACQQVRQDLLSEGVFQQEDIDDAIELAARKYRDQTLEKSETFEQSKLRITSLHDADELSEEKVVEFAQNGDSESVVIALSRLASLSILEVETFLYDRSSDKLLVICRALDFSWESVNQLLSMALREQKLSPQSSDQLRNRYLSLSKPIAEKALRFHQLRQKAIGVVGQEAPKRVRKI